MCLLFPIIVKNIVHVQLTVFLKSILYCRVEKIILILNDPYLFHCIPIVSSTHLCSFFYKICWKTPRLYFRKVVQTYCFFTNVRSHL